MFLGLIFLGLLQTFSKPYPVFRFLLPVFLLLAFFVSVYNKKYLQHIQKYNFWVLFRPILLMVAGFGMFILLPISPVRAVFLLATVLLIFAYELFLGNFSENILISETLIISYGLAFSLFGINAYFPFFKNGFLENTFSMQALYSFFLFISFYLVTRAFYSFIPEDGKNQNISALVISFFASQLFWVLSLLPLHFSILALLLTNFFYFCLILNYYFVFNTLNTKKIYFHFIFIVLTSAIALLSTPWKVI